MPFPIFFTLKPGPQSLPPGAAVELAARPPRVPPRTVSEKAAPHLPGSGRSGTPSPRENGLDFKFPVPFHFTEGNIEPQRINRLS